jgi:hypothetical protein
MIGQFSIRETTRIFFWGEGGGVAEKYACKLKAV